MIYCEKCGKQLNDNSSFCSYCGNPISQCQQNQINQSPQNFSNSMNEEFCPKWGLGRSFAFTENALIYGGVEYPYAQLGTIDLLVIPTSALMNGTAQVNANGKILTLAYEISQKERFLNACAYANEQIDIAHGKKKNYIYILHIENGSKLEIYEDYLVMYYMSTGVTKIISNTLNGGLTSKIISFSDIISIQLIETAEFNSKTIQLSYNENSVNNNITIPVLLQNLELAQKIVAYINDEKQKSQNNDTQVDKDNDIGVIQGTVKTFPVLGKVLEVPESMDILNTYRLKYRQIAIKYANRAEQEYNTKVHDLETFLEFFPKIYSANMEPLLKISMDIFVSEGIWTVTYDSFKKQYTDAYHLALDDYNTTLKSIELTIQANQQSVSNVMGFLPHLRGGGFGLKGAMKGIAQATAFNLVRDGIESSAIRGSNIKPEQQRELYSRINSKILFNNVFTDYWRMFLIVIDILKSNGKNIWLPTNESVNQARNIFENLSNPKFPQERILDVMLDILKTNPYNTNYYKFMISKFGETEEIVAIKDYFGYTEFDNPRIF